MYVCPLKKTVSDGLIFTKSNDSLKIRFSNHSFVLLGTASVFVNQKQYVTKSAQNLQKGMIIMKRVVVTGIGVVSPVGNDVPSFWDSLINGRSGIDFITRVDTSTYKVKVAAEVKDFDPAMYMGKADIRKNDMFTHFAVAAASQAVSDSGIADNVDPERFGVYMGSGIGGINSIYDTILKHHEGGNKKVSSHFIPMMISNIASGVLAIKYNAQGPCLPIVTACATGTNAVGEAFRAIKHGYCDAIIAGGTEATINPVALAGFENMMALYTGDDPKAASTPFDVKRSGFVMGEGAGVLILEEYEHAVKRGANIYAEITGYGTTTDAHHITAPAPGGVGAAKAISLAIKEASAEGLENMYINAHGTSTPLNDVTETEAIKKALGEDIARKAVISSTKSMTGHMLGAAGAVEAIAAILALRDGVIPPTIGMTEQDPACDLNYAPNVAVKKDIDIALSTSLGFGGHNACVVFRKVEK